MNILIPYHWLLEYLDTTATPGELAKYLSLCGPSVERITKIENEPVLEIEVTTNRVDSLSVMGIAREAAAILPRFGLPAKLKLPKFNRLVQVSNPLPLQIVNNPQLCHRIVAIVLEVNIGQSSPIIRKRLIQAGMRPLNNVIDITNYVMLASGQPTHVFDYDKITTHKLIIREAKKGEEVVAFDNKKYILTGRDIVIDDGTGKVIDLPGIIGTKNSVVSADTKRVIFFMENNNAVKIRHTSMTHGIRTMAATLNEKGVDPEAATMAFQMGLDLFIARLKAKPLSKPIDIYPVKPKVKTVEISHVYLENKIGTTLDQNQVTTIFTSLGFQPKANNNGYQVTIPTWRQRDIDAAEDLVEEVARLYGYHNIQSVVPPARFKISTYNRLFYWERKLKDALKYSGYTECYTYSLIPTELILKNRSPKDKTLSLKNPLSEDWVYLRTTLLPSLLSVYRGNESRRNELSLFEIANVYHPRTADLPIEEEHLSLITNSLPVREQVRLVRQQLEQILQQIGQKVVFKKTVNTNLSEGFDIWFKDQQLGFLGRPTHRFYQGFGQKPVTVLELNIEPLLSLAQLRYHYQPISKYASVKEEMTFEFPDHKVPIEDIVAELKKIPMVEEAEKTKEYKRRLTFRLIFLDNKKQLTKKDIIPIRQIIADRLRKTYKAKLIGALPG
jgi:phenylalanyl-tRNA synthetase beta chain